MPANSLLSARGWRSCARSAPGRRWPPWARRFTASPSDKLNRAPVSGRTRGMSQANAFGAYPALRLRRTRASAWSRALHREIAVTPADLIWPLFVTDGSDDLGVVEEPIGSLPGVSRWCVKG